MDLNLVEHLRMNPIIAIVGATNDRQKYGNIILKDLIKKDYSVIPINHRAKKVDGIRAYPNLTTASGDHKLELIVYVVPPLLTLESLKEALQLNLKKIWIQPGAGDENVRSYLDENNFEYIMDACVMIQSK